MSSDFAVQTASSTLAWATASQTDASDPEGLRDRVNLNWRMIPGMLCLVSSVVAACYALYWQSNSLLMIYAPSGACSTYLIYLGYDFQNLQTFSENNERFEGSIQDLEAKNLALAATNKQLTEQVSQFNTALQGLGQENANLKFTNSELSRQVTQLERTVRELDAVRHSLLHKASLHAGQLDTLQTGLRQIHLSVKDDHSTFAENLKIFIQQVELLQQTREEFEVAESHVEQEMKAQATTLKQSAEMLKTIFSEISAWKDKDAKEIKARVELLQQQNGQLTKLREQIGQSSGQLQEQRKQIEELGKIKERFNQLLVDLLAAVEDIKLTKGELAQQVQKAAEAFKQYELTIPTPQ